MFAISLILVVLISSAVLVYQFLSGTFAPAEGDMPMSELRPDRRDVRSSPARAA